MTIDMDSYSCSVYGREPDEKTPLFIGFNDSVEKVIILPNYKTSKIDTESPIAPVYVWTGLSRTELLEYADSPFWNRIRLVLFIAFWSVFLCLLTSVLVLTIYAPRNAIWHSDTMYGILAPSFKDSDNSGIGDIAGIQSKLDYLVDLGVHTVWLSPVFKSPMKDFGYDIKDFKDIDETFGNLEDFKNLLQKMKEKELKLVMDLVPNHSSDEHEWFQKSLSKEEPYTDYYVWAPAKGFEGSKPVPPNNWLSVFGGSAWEWREERKEFYLHQFAKEQPDLNYRNPKVVQEMKDVLKFWLEMGVDGFRLDAIPHLFEDEELRDEPPSNETDSTSDEYSSLKHIYTHNLPEVLDIVSQFRKLLDDYGQQTDNTRRLMMAEVYDSVQKTMEFYGSDETPLADFPFNFLFITDINNNSTAQDVRKTIESWINNMPEGKWPNWVMGNHDKARIATRFGREMVDSLNMVLLLLPGTAITYYGEEIGMEDTPISWEQTLDPAGKNAGPEKYVKHSRDPARTPMQWNDKKNAGFSEADSTWLPVNPNYKSLNVELQTVKHSHLTVYKELVKARQTEAVREGHLEIQVINDCVLVFSRWKDGVKSFITAVNWSNSTVTVDVTVLHNVPDTAQVYTYSTTSSITLKDNINTSEVTLEAKQGVVLTYMPTSQA